MVGRRTIRQECRHSFQRQVVRLVCFVHTLTYRIAQRFAGVGFEDLNIKGLPRPDQAATADDAAWAQIASMLDYKAARAGVVHFRAFGWAGAGGNTGTLSGAAALGALRQSNGSRLAGEAACASSR